MKTKAKIKSSSTIRGSFSIADCPLTIASCPLPIASCPLPVASWILPIACWTMLFLASCNNISNKENSTVKTEEHAHGEGEHHEHIFACPMHPEVTGKEGDKCPKCGMALEHMDEAPEKGNFQMQLTTSPQTIEAGKPATLVFTPKNKDNASAAVPLEVQHEKKIHLILVSEDLSWFNHIHPEYQTDGSYTVEETFPNGGNYLLYADYKPSGSTHQLEKINVVVKGKTVPAKTFTTIQNTAVSDAYTITLKPDDGVFISNKAIHFDGVFTKNGKSFDVNQLQNYLGAKGHMVAINTETKDYLHLHPEVEGVILHFHTTFEKAGNYRVWLQFMADGKLHTVDFFINVEQGEAVTATTEHDHSGHSHKH